MGGRGIVGDRIGGVRQATASHPHLIIGDIMTPGRGGVQTPEVLRKSSRYSKIPVVAVSAHGSGKLEDAVAAGADYTPRKPLNCDPLLTAIGRLPGS